MAIVIDSHQYEIIIGTDVSRPAAKNGAFVEMRALDIPGWETFLFAFRRNATGKITISMYQEDVPLEVLAYFLRVACEELDTDRWPLRDNPK